MARHKPTWANRLLTWLFWLIVAVMVFYVLFPFYWTLKTSITPSRELPQTALLWFPPDPTLQNFFDVFTQQPFGLNLLNSLIISLATVLLSLAVASLAAYALGRFSFRGRGPLLYLILAVSTFPPIALLGGMYTAIRALGLYNTHLGLILAYTTFTLPFSIWVLTSFIRQIPAELEQAATIDGATTLQTLVLVILPLMPPALVTTGLLAFINAWNEFLFALTFTSSDAARTVPVAIGFFAGSSQYESPFGVIMAASVVVTVPLIVLVLIFQRRIVAGLTAGAVKG